MIRPWFQFYSRDWLDNKELRRCSATARAMLVDLMAIAHEGTPYGHLCDQIGPLTTEYMASRCFLSKPVFAKTFTELTDAHRVARSIEEAETYCIPRMVEDERIRSLRAEGGYKSTGNPRLTNRYNMAGNLYLIRRESDSAVKIGIALSVKQRIWKLKSQLRGDPLEVLAIFQVEDMGATEAALHARYEGQRVNGEWFSLSESDLSDISTFAATSLKGSSNGSADGSRQEVPHTRTDVRSDSGSVAGSKLVLVSENDKAVFNNSPDPQVQIRALVLDIAAAHPVLSKVDYVGGHAERKFAEDFSADERMDIGKWEALVRKNHAAQCETWATNERKEGKSFAVGLEEWFRSGMYRVSPKVAQRGKSQTREPTAEELHELNEFNLRDLSPAQRAKHDAELAAMREAEG